MDDTVQQYEDEIDEEEEEEEEEETYQYDSTTAGYSSAPETEVEEIEDLFYKNTRSFRCLAQTLISHSSLLNHILYPFPIPTDPGIDEAFNFVEPEPGYDNIGCEKYKKLCRELQIASLSRVLKSLPTEMLNLKYYGLSEKQIKAITAALTLNVYVKVLNLDNNEISSEGAFWIGEMLRENNKIQLLSMRMCDLGPKGVAGLMEGLMVNQSLLELNLSYNALGDGGLKKLVKGLRENQQIQKLHLCRNGLGEASAGALGAYLAENTALSYLDLSWNDFYTPQGCKELFAGLSQNQSVAFLNVAWNGIGSKAAVVPITKYLKETQALEHLDLSSNRLTGELVRVIRAGIANNGSLVSINLASNLITPADALFLINVFFLKELHENFKLSHMDLENAFVNKNFVPLWKKAERQGKQVRIQGVLSNYTIAGPNKLKLLFERCRYLANKPKKPRLRRDLGHFLYTFKTPQVDPKDFAKLARKFKLKKLDHDVLTALCDAFKVKGLVDVAAMLKEYLTMYPDTQPPPPKVKKKKGKGKRKKSPRSTEEKATETIDSAISSPDPAAKPAESSDVIKSASKLLEQFRGLPMDEQVEEEETDLGEEEEEVIEEETVVEEEKGDVVEEEEEVVEEEEYAVPVEPVSREDSWLPSATDTGRSSGTLRSSMRSQEGVSKRLKQLSFEDIPN